MSIAALTIAVLFPFRGLGGFASGTISGGLEAGLAGCCSPGDGYRASSWGPATAHWAVLSIVISRRWVIAVLYQFSWAGRMRGSRRSRSRAARCRGHGRIHNDNWINWVTMKFGYLQYGAIVLEQGEFSVAHPPMEPGQRKQGHGS